MLEADACATAPALGDGAVVLFHAWPPGTLDALPGDHRRPARAGATFVRVDELERFAGDGRVDGDADERHVTAPAVLAVDGGNSKVDVALVAADGTLLGAVRGPTISHQATSLDGGRRRAARRGSCAAGRRPGSRARRRSRSSASPAPTTRARSGSSSGPSPRSRRPSRRSS